MLTQVKPDAAIIINSTVLERNLYLAVQGLEMGIPVTIALNMFDEATANGVRIDTKPLAELTRQDPQWDPGTVCYLSLLCFRSHALPLSLLLSKKGNQ